MALAEGGGESCPAHEKGGMFALFMGKGGEVRARDHALLSEVILGAEHQYLIIFSSTLLLGLFLSIL
jgi:hypothetical protein